MLMEYEPQCPQCRERQFDAASEAVQFGEFITGLAQGGVVYAETNFNRDVPTITLYLRGVDSRIAKRICKWDEGFRGVADRYNFELMDAYLDIDSCGECNLELNLRSFRGSHGMT